MNAPGSLSRLGANIVAAGSVLAGKAMIGLGLRRAPEGWRRTVGILLRSESTRFALSTFALRVPPSAEQQGRREPLDERTARALRAFLAQEPDAHFALEWLAPVTLRHRRPFVDVVLLRFAPDGRLGSILPFLAEEGPAPPPAVEEAVHAAIIEAYVRTAPLREVDRPGRALDLVRASVGRLPGAEAYARRLLSACCVSFEQTDLSDPVRRFSPPPFAARRTLGLGHLSWVARADRDERFVDVWASAHHVGLDGVPLQDMLNRLECAWGTVECVAFPPPAAGTPFVGPHPCHVPGEREVDQLVTFVDLAPVLALRRALNARRAAEVGGEVTLGTLLAWLLTQEPEFAGVRVASTVDVAAGGGYERDVDVVSLRPADFMTGDPPWGGFVEFAREFNRLIAAARTRTSPVRAGMQTAGLIPAWAHAAVVRSNPASLDDAFGHLCVTIVRDARVFIAPMTDLGLGHGFFAIGNANLPSGNGVRVTAVSVKGDAGRIGGYPAILQRVIDRAAVLASDSTASSWRGGDGERAAPKRRS